VVCAGAAAVALAITTAFVGVRDGGHASTTHFVAASAGAPTPATEPAQPDRPVPSASRSSIRSSGPHVVPAAVGKKPECRLALPSGVWALDVTAARALTMITAGAYRDNIPVATAALAFERAMDQKHLRRVPTPSGAKRMLRHKYRHLPPTWALDSVLALYDPRTLTCATTVRQLPREEMLTNGLTMRAQTMLFAWWAAYGGRVIGGFAPGGVFAGHIDHSAHYEGRAVDISFPTKDPDNNRRGWLLANWLVAQADYLQVATIIFDDHLWSALHSAEGWRPYMHPSGNMTDPTMRHLDHIHVDVEHGLPDGLPPGVAAAWAAWAARSGNPVPPAVAQAMQPTTPAARPPAAAVQRPPAPAAPRPPHSGSAPAPAPGAAGPAGPTPAPARPGIPPLLPPVSRPGPGSPVGR
jgi:hypothetical protein